MAKATSEERMDGFLTFLQWVVDEVGMELKIEKPEDFKGVNREELLAIDFLEKLDEWQPLLSAFKRGEYQFFRKTTVPDSYIVTALRSLAKVNGYVVKSHKKRTMVKMVAHDKRLYRLEPIE